MSLLLGLGVIVLLGLAFSRVLAGVNLPSVTVYLLVGILVGPSVLNVVPEALLSHQRLISDGVLAFIAFMIGRNFSVGYFRRLGRQVLWISVLEALGAWLMVCGAFLVLDRPFSTAVIYGSIASATAPAATVAVIRQYRARGPLTETLIGVVAVDDAWCLILSALSLSVALALQGRDFSAGSAVLRAFTTVALSLLLGALLAYFFHRVADGVRSEDELTAWVAGVILATGGLASLLHLSVLLTAMALGATLANISTGSEKYFRSADTVSFILYEVFFILAGSSLEFALIPGIGLIGLAYIIARVAGKTGGAALGGWLAGAPPAVRRYLGLGLVPQAGVALGVAMSVQASLPSLGNAVLTLVIATTVVNEVVGPPLTRMALFRAGEIVPEPVAG